MKSILGNWNVSQLGRRQLHTIPCPPATSDVTGQTHSPHPWLLRADCAGGAPPCLGDSHNQPLLSLSDCGEAKSHLEDDRCIRKAQRETGRAASRVQLALESAWRKSGERHPEPQRRSWPCCIQVCFQIEVHKKKCLAKPSLVHIPIVRI